MTIRRVLWVAIPLLLVTVLVGGGALAWVLLRGGGSASPVRLVVVGADTNVRLLDDDGTERLIAGDAKTGDYSFPATSPDGGRVAYVSANDAGSAIMVFDVDSGERNELYRSRENVPIDLAWSPDGRHIVFLIGSNLTAQIVPADGSRPAHLVAAGSPSFFAWSPDSEKLLLHVGGHAVDGGKVSLYHPDQEQATPLFGNPGLFQAPAWSVDGRALFYVAQPPYESAQLTLDDLKSDIMRASAEGKDAQLLVREEQADLRIIRAPASDQIAYMVVGVDGFGPLKLVDGASAAGAARVLSRQGEHVTAFFWSPDGRQIAYLTHDGRYTADGERTWHLVDVASGTVRDLGTFQPSAAFVGLQVFFDAYTFSFSPWSPDGRRLAYGAQDGVYVIDLEAGGATKRADGTLGMWVGGK
jgi:TolB protein